MRLILSTALCLGLLASQPSVAAIDPPGKFLENRKQDAMVAMYVRTRNCLRSAGEAALMRNARSEAHIQRFMATVCGSPLVGWLKLDGVPEDEARCYVAVLTVIAYHEDVLRQPAPKLRADFCPSRNN